MFGNNLFVCLAALLLSVQPPIMSMQGSQASLGAAASIDSLQETKLGLNTQSTLKVHLLNGSFNVVKFGDATDIKVA